MSVNTHRFQTSFDAVNFVFAGNARITLVSERTGARFTFRVKAKKGGQGPIHFVSVLAGPDNGSDYIYLGTIFNETSYRPGRKSSIRHDAPSNLAFEWFISHVVNGRMPPKTEVWHEGRCGKCNRVLTVPESIATGLGPVCAAA